MMSAAMEGSGGFSNPQYKRKIDEVDTKCKMRELALRIL